MYGYKFLHSNFLKDHKVGSHQTHYGYGRVKELSFKLL
jgi:hypothetical protein